MKILMVMDPGILVPPKGYGGIERIVEILALQYKAMGHEVHLLVTPGSFVEGCTIHSFGKEGFPPRKTDALKAIPFAWKFLWTHRNEFDLIHSFGRLAYLLPILNHPVKKIMSYQREITNRNIHVINKLTSKNMYFTACSFNLLSRVSLKKHWQAIHNTIFFSKYDVTETTSIDAPLVFLGRLERIKGCHIAIEVAKKTGSKLVIAGNISSLPEEIAYFENEIKPQIDNEQIVYVGTVNDEQKNYWLGKSKAMLFPILWQEPFGIVMIESMACGTPVIAFKNGSVNEVIDDGITGYKLDNIEEMIEVVHNLGNFNRKRCQEEAAARFDVPIIAKQYLKLVNSPGNDVLIVTTGQPAANPRVLKEYQTLKNNGFNVKVFFTYAAEWSYKIDELKFESGILNRDDFKLVGGNPFDQKITYFWSRFFFKLFSISRKIIPWSFLKEMSFVRSSFPLWLAVKKHKADIYISHYLGALPAAVYAAKNNGSVVIFDAEDYHRGEEPYYKGQMEDVVNMENKFLPKVHFLTTASPLIKDAYKVLYPSIKVITINNVFSSQFLQPTVTVNPEKLKLFWFSQNIGPNRGLELVIDALNLLEEDIELTLLGNIKYKYFVEGLIGKSIKPGNIKFMETVPPEEIFTIAARFDIGIAAEVPHCLNRDICLTNKIFTYILAGNCVLASNTSAQKHFIQHYPKIGFIYDHKDPTALAQKIKELFYDRELLYNCRRSATELAATKLNWECEGEKILIALNEIK